jgi:hypothetical protein
MRLTLAIACTFIAATVYATPSDPVEIDLGVADPATPRTYAVTPGTFDIKLVNADPRKTYEIVGENRQNKTTKTLPSGFQPATDLPCESTDEAVLNGHVAYILAVALQAKKDKTPEDKKAGVKLTEADIKDARNGSFGCISADDQKKLADDNKALKAARDKLKTDRKDFEDSKSTDENKKKELDNTEADLDKKANHLAKIEAANVKPASIYDWFNVTFADYTLNAGETLQKTFKAVGEDTTWPIVITTQGGSAAATAKAAAKAASPIASDSPILDRLLNTTATHPDLIVGSCKYTDLTCNARIFINADQISTLTITDIPQGAVTVRITAGEYYPCGAIAYNIARYDKAPDTLIIPLHMRKGMLGIGSTTLAGAEVEAASIYGLDRCPGTNRLLRKTRMFERVESDDDYRKNVIAREAVNNIAVDPARKEADLSSLPDPRTYVIKAPPIASLPLFLRGRSQVVELQFAWADGTRKTFTFPVVYQRFWLDAGGFFVFSRRSDQSINTKTIPGSNGAVEQQKVLEIRREVSIDPNTGIVINIHPGNFPILAFQFGIAANQGRLPSYYFGLGFRAREIGKRGLATLGIGVAMQQEQQFPGLHFGDELPSTDSRLKPVAKYGITFPYVSLSLGFSFGGVSEKTNVADGVQE